MYTCIHFCPIDRHLNIFQRFSGNAMLVEAAEKLRTAYAMWMRPHRACPFDAQQFGLCVFYFDRGISVRAYVLARDLGLRVAGEASLFFDQTFFLRFKKVFIHLAPVTLPPQGPYSIGPTRSTS
jgi:hypothetical protein